MESVGRNACTNAAYIILLKIVATRIVEVGPAWDVIMRRETNRGLKEHYRDLLLYAVQLLSALQTAFVKQRDQNSVVPEELRTSLKPLLRAWAIRYQDDTLGVVAARVLLAWSPELNNEIRFHDLARKMRKQTLGWEACGLPGCGVTQNLKACSKCHTVRYCTSEHQRMHWTWSRHGNKHSQMCYQTEY